MISFRHVYKTYDTDRHALRDISFNLNSSEIIFLTGASGAGKTTLFKLLSLQEKISSGELSYKNENIMSYGLKEVANYRRGLGIVFQDFRLIPEMTIFENIAIPLKIQKLSNKEIQSKVVSVLERFNLSPYSSSYPDYISGGEKQRVAIARSIVHKPNLLIADEPTGNLDRQNAQSVMALFKELAEEGVAVMIATHDEGLIKATVYKNARHIHLENGSVASESIL